MSNRLACVPDNEFEVEAELDSFLSSFLGGNSPKTMLGFEINFLNREEISSSSDVSVSCSQKKWETSFLRSNGDQFEKCWSVSTKLFAHIMLTGMELIGVNSIGSITH